MKKPAKEQLRFTHISLRNWRNFTKAEADLTDRVFLIGPNASGKSNFLDIFRFFHDLVKVGGGFQEAVRARGGVSRLRSLAARETPDIVLKSKIGTEENPEEWEYEINFAQDNQRRPIIKKEQVWHNGREILNRPDKKDNSDPERLTQTYLEQIHANQEFREIADFFETVRYLHIVPQLVRETDRPVFKGEDPYGRDFLEKIAKINEKTRQAWLRRIKETLIVAVPQLQELEFYRDKHDGIPHIRGRYEHWRAKGAWQDEDQFSDGTLRLMGLLWSLLEGKGPLLLEEPELSLHSEVVRYIPQMFARFQIHSGRQIIVSTHSSDLLKDTGIGLDEVFILKSEKEGSSIISANLIPNIKPLLESGLGLDEILIPRTRPDKVEQLSLFGEA